MRKCFACGRRMARAGPWYACDRCQVTELIEEEPPARRQDSEIHPDTGEEIFYFDHSLASWPSPG